MRTKITYVVNRLVTGGLEKLTIDICNKLDPAHFEVSLVVLSNDALDLQSLVKPHVGLRIYPHPYRPTISLRELKRIYTFLRQCFEDKPADVVSVTLYGLRLWVAAMAAKQIPGKATLVKTEHLGKHYEPPLRLRGRLNILIERCALKANRSLIIAVSKTILRNQTRFFNNSVQAVELIENGIDVHKFDPARFDRNRLRTFPEGSIVFMAVGRLDPVKDHRTLLQAWKRVVETFPEKQGMLHLVLVGEGSERNWIERYVDEQGLRNSVSLRGNCPDVPEQLAMADYGVLTSTHEGLPLALIEEMAMGLPVVASDIPGNHELIVKSRAGVLFQPGDVDALAEALCSRITDYSARRIESQRARQFVIDHYSEERMMSEYERFFLSLKP